MNTEIFPDRFIMEKMMSPLFLSYYEFNLLKLTGNKDRHEMLVLFKFWPDLTSHFGVTCP